jgi:DNA gyrase/topoisomerase IV subunit A
MAKEIISDIQTELENRFLTYALSTIVSRSLPDVRDGLKPIHRRILYAMNSMGLNAASKHVKSAKIIGEVLGKYHPHGDSSTYESMVRMAQDFSMRYPLVNGKGNFGSLDGDSPAAYRYTEGKLMSISAFLLNDIKKNTVDFQANYDNTIEEPKVLPSRVPNLLINGSSGIAVGMACSFPPHNLSEVFKALIDLIDDPKIGILQLMKNIKGPDFPTGGVILNSKKELSKAYEEGSGAVKIRSEWKVETLPRGKSLIVITSIPYSVNKSRLIEKIADVIIAKKIPTLLDVRDESDEKVRIVMETKSEDVNEKTMAYLFKHTDLEYNFQLNFTCLKPTGEPSRLSLLEICKYFLDFRKEVVVRRLKYDLELLEKRLHILEGFARIFNDLDKALRLIRQSKSKQEASEKLKKAFQLDDEQTNAVLEIPLFKLVAMEITKILEEMKEKTKEKKKIESILKSPAKIWAEVKTELEEVNKTFGDKRKTKIKAVEQVEVKEEDFIENEEAYLVLSRNGWLRKFKNFVEPSSLKFKENDGFLNMVKADSKELVAFFTSAGMVYVQKTFNLPYTRGGFGDPIQNLFKFRDGEKVIKFFTLPDNQSGNTKTDSTKPPKTDKKQYALDFSEKTENQGPLIVAASNNGYGFRFPISNLGITTKAGKKIFSLKEPDKMIALEIIDSKFIFMTTSKGKGLVTPLDQVSVLSGAGKGVKLMNIGDSILTGLIVVNAKDKATLTFDDNSQKDISISSLPVYNRGGLGTIVSKRKKILGIKKFIKPDKK